MKINLRIRIETYLYLIFKNNYDLMVGLKIIIFDVEDGFCSFIRTPLGHAMLIDCGRGENFSPIKYLIENEFYNIINYRDYNLAVFIATHPHEDHILDIERLYNYMKPSNLARNRYDWEDLKQPGGSYEALDKYIQFQKQYTHPVPDPKLGMNYEMEFGLSVAVAKKINEEKYINNSSIPVVINYKGWKIFFPGDLEKDGWLYLLKNSWEFCNYLTNTDFFVTSHHGHSSGYCQEIYDVMGKPYVNIVSTHRKDESVEKLYSTKEHAHGIELCGETRYMLSTRHDGSIFIDISNKGRCTISANKLEDNI